nr:amino acid ABC transporter permease [Variovorax sp. 770b2]
MARLTHVRRHYYGRYAAAAIMLALLAWLGIAFSRGQIDWHVVLRFITSPLILRGLLNTVLMTVLAMALGIALGIVAAIMRMSSNPVLSGSSRLYVWFFRGTPALLQLLLWFNLALVFPVIGIPGFVEFKTVDVMTPFLAALLALGINQGAYTSEVVRAGLLSVDAGQYEAAKAIGMPGLQALRRIILPQALRVIVPPIGNELIGMVKLTSLASVIQYAEMMHSAENIYFANARVIELLLVGGFYYLVLVTLLSAVQSRLEKRLARGVAGFGGKV